MKVYFLRDKITGKFYSTEFEPELRYSDIELAVLYRTLKGAKAERTKWKTRYKSHINRFGHGSRHNWLSNDDIARYDLYVQEATNRLLDPDERCFIEIIETELDISSSKEIDI